MGIDMTVSDDGSEVTIAVTGKFDFEVYEEFRRAYSGTGGPGVAYKLDLSATDYLDSSALGMLLLLREHAGGETSVIEITRVSPEVGKILERANFGKLFKF